MYSLRLLSFVCLLAQCFAFPSLWNERSEPTSVGSMVPNPANGHWVDTWTAMPQLTEFINLPQPPFDQTGLTFPNSTIRQTLRTTIAADQIRIRLSNTFGLNDLPITRATIALPRAEKGQNITGSSGIKAETLQTLTFSGNSSITIPNGALAVSGPIDFPLKPGQVISISLYLQNGQSSQYITSHQDLGSTSGSALATTPLLRT